MGDWPLFSGQVYGQYTEPANQSYLEDMNPVGSSANTKGSWFELVASCPFDAIGLIIQYGYRNSNNFLVDIGIGPSGSEIVIVPNLLMTAYSGYPCPESIFLPIAIPTGTRIVVRAQCSGTSNNNIGIGIQLLGGGSAQAAPLQLVTAMGVNTGTTTGTTIDPGTTANTKGAWVQITASTPVNFKGLFACFGDHKIIHSSIEQGLIDIGMGASGSEIVIIPNIYWCEAAYGGSNIGPHLSLYYPITIPVGTRLAVRAQSQDTGSGRIFEAALYGLS